MWKVEIRPFSFFSCTVKKDKKSLMTDLRIKDFSKLMINVVSGLLANLLFTA